MAPTRNKSPWTDGFPCTRSGEKLINKTGNLAPTISFQNEPA